MGATVVCGKQVAGVATNSGEILYILFESTYEKNVYPHTERWSCCSFGTFADVMQWVFRGAASCEGGSTQGPRGCITPETYIRSWQIAFRSIRAYHGGTIELKVSDDFYAIIPTAAAEKVKAACESVGRGDVARGIDVGVCLDPRTDHEVLLRLLAGKDRLIDTWRVFDRGCIGSIVEERYQPPARYAEIEQKLPLVWRVNEDLLLQEEPSGAYRLEWEYRLIGQYITEVAHQCEIACTGGGIKAIKQLRNTMASLPVLPLETVAQVTVGGDGIDDYYSDRARRLAFELGLSAELIQSFEVQPMRLSRRDQFFSLSWLEPKQLKWRLGIDSENMPAFRASHEAKQQLVFDL